MAGHGYLRLSLLHVVGLLAFTHVMYGQEYLLSIVKNIQSNSLIALTEETGNWIQEGNHNRQNLTPHDRNDVLLNSSVSTTSGIENKSIIVNVSDPSVSICLVYGNSIFTPFPIPALGTKYIVSYYHPPGYYTSVLVIATHSQKTDVDITFRLDGNINYDGRTYSDGDTLTLSLEEYQTFTIRSNVDLSGTVVDTKQTVAVFSVMLDNSSKASACDQLLPVQHYGHEFIVPSGVISVFETYQIQIVSEYRDTRITFNNGTTVSVGDRGIYRQSLTQNASFYFSSSRPVMTTMYKEPGSNKYPGPAGGSTLNLMGFVVVPPVRLYIKQTSIYPISGTLNVLTDKDATISVKQNKSTVSNLGQWEGISGTRYKVGTWNLRDPYGDPTFITSSTSFTVLFLQNWITFNGGYNFPSTPTSKNASCNQTPFINS